VSLIESKIADLAGEWSAAKEDERAAIERRREIEDAIGRLMKLPEALDGTERLDANGWEIKVTGRIDRKVDTDALQELAREAGLTDHLQALFRWKAEINAKAWDRAADDITRPLTGAITAKPGRPSFSITKKEQG
jgi:hypothetical protein